MVFVLLREVKHPIDVRIKPESTERVTVVLSVGKCRYRCVGMWFLKRYEW